MSEPRSLTPLRDAVCGYISQNPARFHMPGHGGKRGAPGDFCGGAANSGSGEKTTLSPEPPPGLGGVLPFDLTEIPSLDSLYDARGCILESERLAAELYGAARTLYSAGGSTLCIQTMLALTAGGGGTVLFGRNLHRCALAACALLDISPVFLMPGPSGTVSPAAVAAALEAHPYAKAVYLTSPDYLGRITPLSPIAAVCKEAGVPLLVDAAHGAHFPFIDPALNPLAQGAAMCANSAHKTLPALTPGAFLHIGDERFTPYAKGKMALFGSTSPSYPVLLSLEACCRFLRERGDQAFAALSRRVRALRDTARALSLYPLEEGCDPVRLTLEPLRDGLGGRDAAAFLLERGVVCEYADDRYLVFILTPFHSPEDFLRLENGLKALKSAKLRRHTAPYTASLADFAPPAPSMRPRDALFAPCEEIPVSEAAGRVAAEIACPCPPGVPIAVPGEKITEKSAFLLNAYGVSRVKVVK